MNIILNIGKSNMNININIGSYALEQNFRKEYTDS